MGALSHWVQKNLLVSFWSPKGQGGIRQVKRPNFFQKIGARFSVASLFVFGCKIKKRDVAFFSGEEVRIRTSEDVVWDFDGEEGIKGNVTVKACPERITLFVPKK